MKRLITRIRKLESDILAEVYKREQYWSNRPEVWKESDAGGLYSSDTESLRAIANDLDEGLFDLE